MEAIYERFVNDLDSMAQAWGCLEFSIVGMECLDFQRLQDALGKKGLPIKLRLGPSVALNAPNSNHTP